MRNKKEDQDDIYSIHFARFASKLESHLTKHGVACIDADRIIEESSIIYFDKLKSPRKPFIIRLKNQDTADIFVRSACQAIESFLPEARNTFGSYSQILGCIR